MNEKVVDERKVEKLTRWLKISLVGILVLTVVGTIFLFVKRQSEQSEVAAYSLLFEAERMERDLGEGSNPFDPNFYKKMQAWSSEDRTAYKTALEKVVAEKSSTQAAQLARLRLARLAYEAGEKELAYKMLDEAKSGAEEALIKAQALQTIGVFQEDEQGLEKALEAFREAAAVKNSPLAPLSLLSEARVLRALNKSEDAKKIYQQVIEKYPNSLFERQARALNLMEAN